MALGLSHRLKKCGLCIKLKQKNRAILRFGAVLYVVQGESCFQV